MTAKTTLQFVREQIDQSPDEVFAIFDKLPESSKHSKEQLLKGFKVELEHANTVGGNSLTVAKIVLDHLKERPDYYDKLLAAGL